MTVPLDTANDIRSMDAAGRSRSEIARMLNVSRNTVSKHANMRGVTPPAETDPKEEGSARAQGGDGESGQDSVLKERLIPHRIRKTSLSQTNAAQGRFWTCIGPDQVV